MERTETLEVDLTDPDNLLYNIAVLESELKRQSAQNKNGLVDLIEVINQAKEHFKPSLR